LPSYCLITPLRAIFFRESWPDSDTVSLDFVSFPMWVGYFPDQVQIQSTSLRKALFVGKCWDLEFCPLPGLNLGLFLGVAFSGAVPMSFELEAGIEADIITTAC